MEKVTIRKFREHGDGVEFGFSYVGEPFPVYDEKKVGKLIDKFLSKGLSHCDMLRNVSYIRTMLNTCREELLVVQYKDGDNEEIVKYDNGDLVLYESNHDYMQVKFQSGGKLEVSFSDKDNSITQYQKVKGVEEKFDAMMDHITSLSYVSPVYLDQSSKAIITAYQLFYNENPDFSKDDINIKIQTMLSILAQFNICLGDYSFRIHEKMPESFSLSQVVNKLFPLGEITVIEDPLEFKDEAKETIEIVGKTITEMIGNEPDRNEALITISKTIYAGRYGVTAFDVKKLVEQPDVDLTYREADFCVQLVKTIKRRLDNNSRN